MKLVKTFLNYMMKDIFILSFFFRATEQYSVYVGLDVFQRVLPVLVILRGRFYHDFDTRFDLSDIFIDKTILNLSSIEIQRFMSVIIDG